MGDFVRICDCPAAYRAPLGSVSGFGVCGALKRVVLGGILSLPGKPTAWLTFHRDVFVPPRSDCSTASVAKWLYSAKTKILLTTWWGVRRVVEVAVRVSNCFDAPKFGKPPIGVIA